MPLHPARDPVPGSTIDTVESFAAAFNRHDVDAIMALMTPDCVFENTCPPPDGERFAGQDAVREVWERLFRDAPDAFFETEEIVAIGDRCVLRWLFRWGAGSAGEGRIRGVDLFRVRDGKVAEKLSYVKG
jgi:ketosteroid isomerase-like protein